MHAPAVDENNTIKACERRHLRNASELTPSSINSSATVTTREDAMSAYNRSCIRLVHQRIDWYHGFSTPCSVVISGCELFHHCFIKPNYTLQKAAQEWLGYTMMHRQRLSWVTGSDWLMPLAMRTGEYKVDNVIILHPRSVACVTPR